MPKKVGIFAGTFDPIHGGHVAFAQEALRQCGLDKVFFLVEPRPRRKQGVRSLDHRINMARLAVEDEPKLGLIVLEQARFNVIETLPLLVNRFEGAELNMLLGDDVLAHLAEWPHVDELITAVRFIIGVRGGTDIKNQVKSIEQARSLNFNYDTFTTTLSNVSSSRVRAALRRGQTPKDIQPKVLAYIRAHGLYHTVQKRGKSPTKDS